ncbi:hypothetical protein ACIBG7_32065 [Nonomuraea sp. NPDC050328]|uniref:hypothetical protein n=1 Tax=Nonomuraea sp. NPDC050328 TaxID=3364361 RepID=UPI0037953DF8
MLTSLVVTASLLLAGAPAQSTATKSFTYRGMTLQIPKTWKVGKADAWGVHIKTGGCDRTAAECRGFYVLGPKGVATAREGNPYDTEQRFHPGTGVSLCTPDKRYYEGYPGKLVTSGLRQVGPGHKAYYRVWLIRCMTMKYKPTDTYFQERVWYLPKSKILVFDAWGTNRLGAILKAAAWR